jgi:hypothetical protein
MHNTMMIARSTAATNHWTVLEDKAHARLLTLSFIRSHDFSSHPGGFFFSLFFFAPPPLADRQSSFDREEESGFLPPPKKDEDGVDAKSAAFEA